LQTIALALSTFRSIPPNIRTESTNLPTLKRIPRSILVHDSSTGHIDENNAILHNVKHLIVDESTVLSVSGSVQTITSALSTASFI
jgi:hypothetical protein